jgi:uncharacterized membrane protein (UPF0182 family)
MRETLDAALSDLFGGPSTRRVPEPEIAADSAAPAPAQASSSQLPALLQQARQHYQAAIQAQRDLDWAHYGEEMRELGRVLNEVAR